VCLTVTLNKITEKSKYSVPINKELCYLNDQTNWNPGKAWRSGNLPLQHPCLPVECESDKRSGCQWAERVTLGRSTVGWRGGIQSE